MQLLRPIFMAAVAATVSTLTAGAGMAHGLADTMMVFPDTHSFSGSWPVTISQSQHSNGTDCLTLKPYGTNGGTASLVIGSQRYPYGSYQVFNKTLVATIQAQGYGQNAGLVFIGSVNHGVLGKGVFDEVYGGSAFDEGALAFGTKGGC
jgi:hypothetical protein